MRKKRILLHTNFCGAKTGLGRQAKAIYKYLYSTSKYELVQLAMGMPLESPEFARFPWRTLGGLPSQQVINQILSQNPNQIDALSHRIHYGGVLIDDIIREVKPDVYIGSDDWWAFTGFTEKLWWNKLNSILHITLDSLPILPDAVKKAPKVKHYFVWADFAKDEMHRLGCEHVQLLRGAIDPEPFCKKESLRDKFNIPKDALVFGFVFRNQLRKEVAPLMAAFKDFWDNNPNSYLLFHTHWAESGDRSWDIHRFCDELSLPKDRVLTTYVCRNCGGIEVKEYKGQDQDCRLCNTKGTPQTGQVTCNTQVGCTEAQLCDVYNLMNAYIHPMNAGGLEIPIVEAMYCELPVATVGYSCGTTFTNQPFVFPIEFCTTRQIGTQFIRACPIEGSIIEFMNNVRDGKVQPFGKEGRNWALSQFCPSIIGKQLEEYLDSLPLCEWDFDFKEQAKEPEAKIEQISDNLGFVKELYAKILLREVSSEDDDVKYWIGMLERGVDRKRVEDAFRKAAVEDNNKLNPPKLEDFLTNDKKRVLLVLPESVGDVFMATSLFESIRKRYPKPEWTFYFATKPQYFGLLDFNPHLDKVIPYHPLMENALALEGAGKNKGLFDVVYLLHVGTQRVINYIHNGEDKSDLNISQKSVE